MKTPNTYASLNFYQCPSCTIQQTGGKIEREQLVSMKIIHSSTITLVFQSSLDAKGQVYLVSSSYFLLNVSLFIHVLMHLCLFQLCGGENRHVNFFSVFNISSCVPPFLLPFKKVFFTEINFYSSVPTLV